MKSSPAVVAAALSALAPRHDSCNIEEILTPDYDIPAVHPGWQAQLIMDGLVKPRTIAIDSEGALIVLDAGAGVRHVTFNDHGHTCLEVDENRLIIANEDVSEHDAVGTQARYGH